VVGSGTAVAAEVTLPPFESIGDTRTDPLPLFLSLLFAKGIATQLDPVRVVNDAIQDGVREGGITDQVMPLFDRDLAGDQCGTTTITLFDDLQQIASLPVIQNKQPHPAERPHQACEASVATGQTEIGEQPGDALIEHGMIVSAGLVAEGAGEPGFSDAGRTDNDQILLLLDPAAQGKLLEQRAVETAIGTIVDALDGSTVAQPRVTKTRGETPVMAVGQFAIQQQSQPFGVIEFTTAPQSPSSSDPAYDLGASRRRGDHRCGCCRACEPRQKVTDLPLPVATRALIMLERRRSQVGISSPGL
jgi:hypothetical protein